MKKLVVIMICIMIGWFIYYLYQVDLASDLYSVSIIQKVKLGMQMNEVLMIKGIPVRTSQTWTVDQGYIYWLYYDDGVLPTYTFINGSLTQFNGGW